MPKVMPPSHTSPQLLVRRWKVGRRRGRRVEWGEGSRLGSRMEPRALAIRFSRLRSSSGWEEHSEVLLAPSRSVVDDEGSGWSSDDVRAHFNEFYH